jgi:Ca-activated chloride channel family protein
VAVSGGNVSNAARVVAGMRAGFRSCYQRGLNENPSAAGAIRLGVRVGAQGQVVDAVPVATGTLPASVVACVVARARAAQFDPPEGGKATIQFPVTFTPTTGAPVETPRPFPIGALGPRPEPQDVAVIRAGDENWRNQGEPALAKLQAELAAAPESRKKHEAVVRGLLLRGQFAPALAAAERFVELDPDLPVARELLAYAAVASGDRKRAVAAIDAAVETAPTDLKAHGRAARAFEALNDEARACAHWRSMFELAPGADSAQVEAFRCRARVLGDRLGALRDAKAVAAPGPLLKKLLPLLESGPVPPFEKSSGSAGQFETSLSCEGSPNDCPYVIVITPTGTVFSPWTPALGRSSPTSFAFSGLLTGAYRVLLVGGAPGARGKVEVRALNGRTSFDFAGGHPPTLANVQVTIAGVRAGSGVGPGRLSF